MQPWFEPVITPSHSKDYLKIATVLHAFTGIVLWYSGFFLPLKMLMGLFLCFSYWQRVKESHSAPFKNLSYLRGSWILLDTQHKRYQYEKVAITFDAGIFIILTLSCESAKIKLFIFKDQISNDDRRLIKLSTYQ